MPRYVYFNRGKTTVSSGGTTAPAAGTVESWTVASSATFSDGDGKTASTGRRQFLVVDPADTSTVPELCLVTNVSGTTWTVTRGVESTTPFAHAAGFTVQAIHTAGSDTSTVKGAALGRVAAYSAGLR